MDTAGGIAPIGYEALIRARGSLRVLEAMEVFAAASEFGGREKLDQQIQAIQLEQGLPLLQPNQRLFLNMPSYPVHEEYYAALSPYASRLVLEVSEKAKVTDAQFYWLHELHKTGAEIAIDDFGVGSHNLATLTKLQPDGIKLDMSFVHNQDYETIRKVRRFAEDWNASLIVEGIETEQEAAAVMDAGVRYIQGFFYSRPQEAWYYWL